MKPSWNENPKSRSAANKPAVLCSQSSSIIYVALQIRLQVIPLPNTTPSEGHGWPSTAAITNEWAVCRNLSSRNIMLARITSIFGLKRTASSGVGLYPNARSAILQ